MSMRGGETVRDRPREREGCRAGRGTERLRLEEKVRKAKPRERQK